MPSEITYGQTVAYSVLDTFGLELDEAGHVQHEDGGYVPSHCGTASVRIDRVAGFVDPPGTTDIVIVCNTPGCVLSNTVDV
jgi:hypothetical protein